MKWNEERGENVEDRRKINSHEIMIGGGLSTLIIAAIIFFLGGDPSNILNFEESSAPIAIENYQLDDQDRKIYNLISMLDAWNTKTWTQIFNENGMKYVAPKIVMFSNQTSSGCGLANATMGPFYCPADHKVYIDMIFFNELQSRYGAKVSEFTIAYVLGHEVGHHVQTLLGITQKVEQIKRSRRYSKAYMNRISVAVELQADFYAGVWARKNHERIKGGILEPGDIDAAISAAQAVGDDNIQKISIGYVNQELFTHGSSEQRIEWFMKGYNTGDIKEGDTFRDLLQ